jgi:Cu-processing system permease protein
MIFKIAKYVVLDIIKSRVLLILTVLLLAIALAFFNLENDTAKALVSLLSVILIILPLVSIIYSTTYYYNSYEFMELLMAQPIKRKTILLAEYIGITVSLLFSFFVGIGIPVFIFQAGEVGWVMILSGMMLVFCFVAFAFLASTITRDKARGIGVSIMLWFFLAIIYDALVLGILFGFSEYPLEKLMVVLASLNPIDLARISVMLKLDVSALMGYTGALYKQFFGGWLGIVYAVSVMALWTLVPLWLSLRVFKKKNI